MGVPKPNRQYDHCTVSISRTSATAQITFSAATSYKTCNSENLRSASLCVSVVMVYKTYRIFVKGGVLTPKLSQTGSVSGGL